MTPSSDRGHQAFSARLWSIFDRFEGFDGLAYRHPSGDLTFARLHAAVLDLLSLMAGLPGPDARRPVLIWGHKDPRYVAAYWACLLDGRTLVPVEADTPTERIRQIVETCDPSAILIADPDVDGAVATRLANMAVPGRRDIRTLADPRATRPGRVQMSRPRPSANDVAYMMFSSGTLGAPKGIRVTYANLIDFIDWLEPLLAPGPDVVAVTGNIRHCFDVSLFELWTSWTRRLPLIALDHAELADSTRYIDRLAEGDASLWVSTPSLVRLFLKNRRFSAEGLPQLKTFLFCGEPLTKPLVQGLFERFPGCRVVNTYGPTECTVAVTSVDIEPQHLAAAGDLSIGRARPGTTLEPAPGTAPGEPGEIWIRGASVGAGYAGLKEKQALAFPEPGLYRTGDRGRRTPDGLWYFHGRIDREVKIQGMRIDLNEVEAHLRDQPGVADVAVEPHAIRGELRALSAYVVGFDQAGQLEALAAAMAAELPAYLVPRFWYAGFPEQLNMNSKLDRSALEKVAAVARLRHVFVPTGPTLVPSDRQKEPMP
jgi:D-alanine--poly(phosphoribitol) ligase subunit 1